MGHAVDFPRGDHGRATLIERINNLRASSLPFAAPKRVLQTCEAFLVRDVLRVLQGYPTSILPWNPAGQCFYVVNGVHVLHLSQSSLYNILQVFTRAGTSLRRVEIFVQRVLKGTTDSWLKPISQARPTLEAFVNAVHMQLASLRMASLEKEVGAAAGRAGTSVTLLSLFADLSRVFAGAEFLEHVVNVAVRDPEKLYNSDIDAGQLAAHILSSLYDELNSFCLTQDDQEDAYGTLLLLFVGSLWPMVTSLDTWLREGILCDPAGELFFFEDKSVPIEDSAFWESGFHFRNSDVLSDDQSNLLILYQSPGSYQSSPKTGPNGNSRRFSAGSSSTAGTGVPRRLVCPSFLQPIAKAILSAGKSLQLLQHVRRKHAEGEQESPQIPAQVSSKVPTPFVPVGVVSLMLFSGRKGSSDLEVIPSIDSSSSEASPGSTSMGQEQSSLFEQFCASLRSLLGEASSKHSSEGKVSADPNCVCSCSEKRMPTKAGLIDVRALANVEKLLQYPTLLPSFQERNSSATLPSGSNQEVVGMLQWIQGATLKATPALVAVQECLTSSIKKQVDHIGQQLLAKFMGEWRLMEELALLRAIYLVGSGDLLQQFASVLFNKLDRGEPWDDFYELNTMLQESVRNSSHGMVLPALDSLVVTVLASTSEKAERAPRSVSSPPQIAGRAPSFGINSLDSLFFTYKVAWPLELIIDSNAIKRYNQVMLFLLKVKRAKHALDKACRWTWKKGVGDAAVHKRRLLLQQKLMHFVNTLHQYVMDRVLYSAWVDLCENMSSAGSLDEVIACHDAYLVSIQRQCLVAPDKLWTLIAGRVKTILGLALNYYSTQRVLCDGVGSPSLTARCQLEIERVEKQFDECMVFLMQVLSFKLNVGHFPHLADLMTRINYNFYYMTEDGQLSTPLPELLGKTQKRSSRRI